MFRCVVTFLIQFACQGLFAQATPQPQPLGLSAPNTTTATPAPTLPAASTPAPESRESILVKLLTVKHETASGVHAAVLSDSQKDQPLDGLVGSFGSTYAFITVLFYSDFPELASPIRTPDPRPHIYVAFDANPRGRLFLVKTRVNRSKNTRSVKMGTSGYGSVSSVTSPDQDWVIPSTVKLIRPGIWEFTPNKELFPGEYGLFATLQAGNIGAGGGELFDFGVDR